MVMALPSPAFAADSASESRAQAYLEYNKSQAAYRRENQIRTVVLLVVVAGLVAFVIIPARRNSKRALEISEQQQQTLEEIRDLLKKQ